MLDGGMVYVGHDLPAVQEGWDQEIEPALIDPRLPVATSNPDRTGSSLDYWPSYQRISAQARAGYLEWLAGGRRDPAAPIGFVFLFFYGIERRVLADSHESTAARGEKDTLLAEVEALLAVYGENRSFNGYASSFLEVGRLLHESILLSKLRPSYENAGWDMPITTKLALGTYAVQGEPIPVEWGLSWILTSSSFRFRTPANRCSEEFRRLLEIRYPEHFPGGGLKVKPNKTRLSVGYRPASPSFKHGQVDLGLPDLPDVTILSGPTRKLQQLVDRVTGELDPYSRWIGRKDDRDSMAALALLPSDLAAERKSPESDEFERTINEQLQGRDWVIVDTTGLVSAWPSTSADKLTKRESVMLARFLELRGLGIEPDPRFEGPPLGKTEKAILFHLDGHESAMGQESEEPSAGYQATALLLHLAAAVAIADGEVAPDEEERLEEYVEDGTELRSSERHRLRQHLRWLVTEPPGMEGMKRRIKILDQEQRRALGRFLITVAGADGRIDPEEIKILRKIYTLLDLEAEAVFSDVHALMSGDDEPVTVVEGKPIEGYSIPAPDGGRSGDASGFTLDAEKIRAMRQSTERVANVLAGVFEDDDMQPETVPPPESEHGQRICGLDAAHSAFLLRLADRTSWDRLEVEQLAERLGVLPDGALELINDAAVENCGDLLLEGGEVIEIDTRILQEMIP